MNPTVDWYFEKPQKWQPELERLRLIVLDCLLTEELKWGVPCYTYQKRNVVLLHTFKEYCAVLFVKGALLADPDKLLTRQTQNVQAARQIRFSSLEAILAHEASIKAYIYEALAVEKAGLSVPLKQTAAYSVPDELNEKLTELPGLRTAFEALSPGRQRAYLLHFSAPKQAKTRRARVEKAIQPIMDGKGLTDY